MTSSRLTSSGTELVTRSTSYSQSLPNKPSGANLALTRRFAARFWYQDQVLSLAKINTSAIAEPIQSS
jgi:hypothetical protein